METTQHVDQHSRYLAAAIVVAVIVAHPLPSTCILAVALYAFRRAHPAWLIIAAGLIAYKVGMTTLLLASPN